MFEKFNIENTTLFIEYEESIFDGDADRFVLYATDGNETRVVQIFDTKEEAEKLIKIIKIRFKKFFEYKKQYPKKDFSKRLSGLFRPC